MDAGCPLRGLFMCLYEVYRARNGVCLPHTDSSFPEWSPRVHPQERSLQTQNWGGKVSLSRVHSGQGVGWGARNQGRNRGQSTFRVGCQDASAGAGGTCEGLGGEGKPVSTGANRKDRGPRNEGILLIFSKAINP